MDEHAPLFNGDSGFDLQYRHDDSGEIIELATNVLAEEIPSLVEEKLDLSGVRPLLESDSSEPPRIEGYQLDIDVDVTYFSLMTAEPLEVGRELTPRIIIREESAGSGDSDLTELFRDVDTSPCTAKKWMGFYYLKNCYELPRVDELAGYEYEVKLDTETLEFDVNRLPSRSLKSTKVIV